MGPPPSARVDVDRLILRLGFPERVVRERAESELIGRGPAILGLLATAPPPLSAEARLRLARVIGSLETAATERAIEASTLDLVVKAEPLVSVLDRIASRTGNLLPDPPRQARAHPVTLEVKRSTYWEVIGELLPLVGLTLKLTGEGLRIEAGPPPTNPGVAAGPLLVRARASRADVPPNAAGTTAGRRIRVEVQAVWEPRLEPFVARLPLESVQIDGPAGESLAPSSRRGVLEAVVRREAGWVSFPLVVAAPDQVWPESVVVRGTLRWHLAGAEHLFQLPPPTAPNRPVRQSVGSVSVTLHSLRDRGEHLEAVVEAAYDGPSEALASHRRSLLDRRLRLVRTNTGGGVAAAFLEREPIEQEVIGRSDRGWTVRAVFRDEPGLQSPAAFAAGGLRLDWKLPIAIHALNVDFLVPGVVVAER